MVVCIISPKAMFEQAYMCLVNITTVRSSWNAARAADQRPQRAPPRGGLTTKLTPRRAPRTACRADP